MSYIEFERQDLRRMWLMLGAISVLDSPSLAVISKELGINMTTLIKVAERINSPQLIGTEIAVVDRVYSIISWGIVTQLDCENYFKSYRSNA